MPDRQMPGERIQGGLVEYLADQPHVLEDHDAAPIRYRHTGRFLAAMLQSEHAVIGELGDHLARCEDPEYATLLARIIPLRPM